MKDSREQRNSLHHIRSYKICFWVCLFHNTFKIISVVAKEKKRLFFFLFFFSSKNLIYTIEISISQIQASHILLISSSSSSSSIPSSTDQQIFFLWFILQQIGFSFLFRKYANNTHCIICFYMSPICCFIKILHC